MSELDTIVIRPEIAVRAMSPSKQKGKVARALKEQRSRLYIIRRCIVMLLCWHD
ncbi:uncharacterized protein [Zea mays]|uniref:uncharacterized protein n=1 Tax=Zea mays TaxID=4577 RepID=UPI001651F5CB|nr:uncharacterized protein LOC118476254 [Zea mays]